MMNKFNWVRCGSDGDDDVTIISSSWCVNRSGICLSFAVPIEVMTVSELSDFGETFKKAVNESYREMLKQYFSPKTDDPIVHATDDGELIMLWSFQGENDKATKEELKENGIEEIEY